MEMQTADEAAGANQYGTEAGYSEDYAPAPTTVPVVDDQGYDTMGSNGQGGVEAGADGQPRNPFTQQQYESQQKSSNPFK